MPKLNAYGRIGGRAFFLASTLLTMPAHVFAQSANTPQAYATAPADHLLVTPTGVDLRTGRYDYKQTDLSIGGEGDSGLQLIRLARGGVLGHDEPFANFTHNFDIMIAEKRVHITGGDYYHGSGDDFRMIVRFGGRSETFDSFTTGPYFEQVSKSATAKLTYTGVATRDDVIYKYQALDGTLAVFRPLGSGDCSSAIRCAYVSQITYPDGTDLSFEYDVAASGTTSATRLRSVTSSRGYLLIVEYDGDSKTVSKACTINLAYSLKPATFLCPADAVASSSYAYTTQGETLLASSTDASGGVSKYQYGSGSNGTRTIGFVKPGSSSPWLTNSYSLTPNYDTGSAGEDGVHEVVYRQALADGQSYDIFMQTASGDTEGTIDQRAGGDIADASGHRTEVRYGFPKYPYTLTPGYNPDVPRNVSGGGPRDPSAAYQLTSGPISIRDPLGRVTTFDYCDPTIAASLAASEPDRCVVTPLRSYTDPEGIKTELTYSACNSVTQTRRHAKPGKNTPDAVLTVTYECLQPKYATKPLSLTDENGNRTDYTYDAAHGGILTETSPSINGVRAQKRYLYGQRYAWIAAGTNTYSKATSSVWVPTQVSSCLTGAAASSGIGCAKSADEVVTTFDYGPDAGPNNLLLRGKTVTADGQSLRTCYRYDGQGNKIAETSPRAGLTTCS